MNHTEHFNYCESFNDDLFIQINEAYRRIKILLNLINSLNNVTDALCEEFENYATDIDKNLSSDEKQLLLNLLTNSINFALRSELDNYYNKDQIQNFNFLQAVPDYYITEEDLQRMIDEGVFSSIDSVKETLKDYYTKSEIDGILNASGFLTSSALADYYTKQQIDDLFTNRIDTNISYSSNVLEADKGSYKLGTLSVGTRSYDILGYLGNTSTTPEDPDGPNTPEDPSMVISHYVMIFKLSSSKPEKLTNSDGSYDFSTGTFTSPTGWSDSMPEFLTTKLWFTTNVYYSNGKQKGWDPITEWTNGDTIIEGTAPSYSYRVQAYCQYNLPTGETMQIPKEGKFNITTKKLEEAPYSIQGSQRLNWEVSPNNFSDNKSVWISYNNYIITEDSYVETGWETPIMYYPNIDDILQKAGDNADKFFLDLLTRSDSELQKKLEEANRKLEAAQDLYNEWFEKNHGDDSVITMQQVYNELEGKWSLTSTLIDFNNAEFNQAMMELSYNKILLEVQNARDLDQLDSSSISYAMIELVKNKILMDVVDLGPVEDVVGELMRKLNSTTFQMTPTEIVLMAMSGYTNGKYRFIFGDTDILLDTEQTIFVPYIKYGTRSDVYEYGIAKCVEVQYRNTTVGALELVDEYAKSLSGTYYLGSVSSVKLCVMVSKEFVDQNISDTVSSGNLIYAQKGSVESQSVESAMVNIVKDNIALSVVKGSDDNGAYFSVGFNDDNEGLITASAAKIVLNGDTIADAIKAKDLEIRSGNKLITALKNNGDALFANDSAEQETDPDRIKQSGASFFSHEGHGYIAGGLIKWERDKSLNDNVTLTVSGIINANAGLIGGWTIGQTKLWGADSAARTELALTPEAIYSITSNLTNWRLNQDGSGSLANGKISWTKDGELTVAAKIEADAAEIWRTINTSSVEVGHNKASLFNNDGSGYVANENISWDKYGNITLKNAKGFVQESVTRITVDNYQDYIYMTTKHATNSVPYNERYTYDWSLGSSVPSYAQTNPDKVGILDLSRCSSQIVIGESVLQYVRTLILPYYLQTFVNGSANDVSNIFGIPYTKDSNGWRRMKTPEYMLCFNKTYTFSIEIEYPRQTGHLDLVFGYNMNNATEVNLINMDGSNPNNGQRLEAMRGTGLYDTVGFLDTADGQTPAVMDPSFVYALNINSAVTAHLNTYSTLYRMPNVTSGHSRYGIDMSPVWKLHDSANEGWFGFMSLGY